MSSIVVLKLVLVLHICEFGASDEPVREKKDVMVFRFVVLQIRMHCPLFWLLTCVFALSFLKAPATCLRTAKALARLRLCAVSPDPLLVAYVISTIFSCAIL